MHKPFAVLDEWVRQGRIRLAEGVAEVLPDDLPDEALFEFAMRGVNAWGWSAVPLLDRPPLELQAHDHEAEALRELENFIRYGNVEIENSPEYIEGSVH